MIRRLRRYGSLDLDLQPLIRDLEFTFRMGGLRSSFERSIEWPEFDKLLHQYHVSKPAVTRRDWQGGNYLLISDVLLRSVVSYFVYHPFVLR